MNQADALEARRGSGEWIDPISSIGNAEVDAGVELKVIGHRVSHADAKDDDLAMGVFRVEGCRRLVVGAEPVAPLVGERRSCQIPMDLRGPPSLSP